MPDALHAVGPVNHGGFIQLAGDAGDGGKIDDGAPAHTLPDADQQVGDRPVVQFRQEGDAAFDPAPLRHQHIHDAGSGLEQLVRHGPDDDPGKEMGQIQHGLRYLLETGETQLIEHQGQHDGHREADRQVQQVENDGVFQSPEEILVPENLGEDVHADPLAAGISLGGLIVIKNHPEARIGSVIEEDYQNDRNQQKQVQMPVPPQGFVPGRPLPQGRGSYRFCSHLPVSPFRLRRFSDGFIFVCFSSVIFIIIKQNCFFHSVFSEYYAKTTINTQRITVCPGPVLPPPSTR